MEPFEPGDPRRVGGYRLLGRLGADERLRAVIERCLRPDPAGRPALAGLAAAVAGGPSAAWPSAVTARIAHREAEAANPPVAVPPRPGPVRRTLVPGVLVIAGAATVLALVQDDRSGTAAPRPESRPAATASANPAPTARALEFYVFGTSRLKSLTITVDGRETTVRDRRLPYRKVVQISQEPTTWELDYRFGEGTFAIAVTVDGTEYGGAGGSSRGPDVTDSAEGTV